MDKKKIQMRIIQCHNSCLCFIETDVHLYKVSVFRY